MRQEQMTAMILAGGRGTRLEMLTDKVAKPAVYFGGKYRIIDFPLSNCANSGIKVVGVLTQYESVFLNSYVAQDLRWGLDTRDGGTFVLPPREKEDGFDMYRGTADAITQNIDFLDQFDSEYVLVLSGDHIYKMDYSKMLAFHKEKGADATIAVLEVSLQEASRFGIMNTDSKDMIIEFEEKPAQPKSNLASMGIYIFTWKKLRQYLLKDEKDERSTHDFGKDIIPQYLSNNESLAAYRYTGYWKDVGTLDSLWEGNMDLLNNTGVDIDDPLWRIYTLDTTNPPQYLLENAKIKNVLMSQGCVVDGTVEHSVIFHNVIIEKGAIVKDSVILPGAIIRENARVERVIVAENVVIGENKKVSSPKEGNIKLIWKDV